MIRFAWLVLAICSLHGDLFGQSVSAPTLEPRLARVGAVGHRDERRVDFTISNPGSTPLVFTKVHPSCSCMTVEFDDKTPIPAGESRQGVVVVSFGRGFGEFHKHVDFSIRGLRSPLVLHIFASFHPGVTCKSLELVLEGFQGVASAPVNADSSGTKEPSSTAILELVSVVPKGPPPTVTDIRWARGGENLTTRVLEPGRDRVRIEVSYGKEHPEGPISGELNATVNGRLLIMPVRGHVYRGIRLVPPQANFNVVKTPTDYIQTIELIPADPETKFEILSSRYEARARSPSLEPTLEKKPRPGGGWILTLRINPEAGMKGFGGNLILTTDHPDKPELTVTVFGHVL